MRNKKFVKQVSSVGIIFLTVLVLIFSRQLAAGEQSVIKVPVGSQVLIDGKIDKWEWIDAEQIDFAGVGAIYLKRDKNYLYIAVRTEKPEAASVDLYFDKGDRNSLLDFHASAKLGERKGKFGSWPDWIWWNNIGWAANVARINKFQPSPEFLPDEAKEFQIELTRVQSKSLLLSMDIQSLSGQSILPIEGISKHNRKWIELEL